MVTSNGAVTEVVSTRERLPEIAYCIFEKNFEEPDVSEGGEVVRIPFCLDMSVNENWTKYYV